MVIGLIWFSFVPLARAEVTFYLQREGAPDDGGLERFQAAAAPLTVQNYEDPLLGGPGATVPGIYTDPQTFVAVRGSWGGDFFDPQIASSTEFNAPGYFFNNAIVAGVSLRVEAPIDLALQAVGMWIFDDGRDADSVYLVRAIEANGSVWISLLANAIPMNDRLHEIEGFVGAVSTVGILQLDIRAVDPVTLVPHFDFFEVDYVMAAVMALPTEPPVVEVPPPAVYKWPWLPNPNDWNWPRYVRHCQLPAASRACRCAVPCVLGDIATPVLKPGLTPWPPAPAQGKGIDRRR